MYYQKASAKSGSGSGSVKKTSGGSKKSSASSSGVVAGAVAVGGSSASNYQSAYNTISAMITAGYSKNQVLSEIAIAQKKGALTTAEAARLRATFNPKGQQYT
jgi:hypothetical protein